MNKMTHSLIIKNVAIIDGTGAPWYKADIAIDEDRITEIGKIQGSAEKIIDGKGLIASPGWIDIHTHADHTILGNPDALSYTHQGITTVTMGNCGLSMYPVTKEHKNDLIEYMKPFTGGLPLTYNWTSLEEFTQRIMDKGTSVNLVPFVGHGSIRIATMGFENRKPTGSELEQMKTLLADSLKQGSFGISTGLGYPPGFYADDTELIELSRVLREYNGIYSTHMRGNDSNLADTIQLARSMMVPVEVSHIGSSCAKIPSLRGRHRETTLRLLDEARAEGIDITADIYPYVAGSSLLSQVVPDWLHEGGVPRMLERLKSPEIRKQIAKEYKESGRDFSKVIVSYVKTEANKDIEGMNIAEIAEKRGMDIVDALCELIIAEKGEAMNITFWGLETDVDTLVKHPLVMPCSDGWLLAPTGPLGSGKPHPRCYGAFPRYIRQYVKEKKILRLEEAIRRMTSMPATRLGLQDRGIIRTGMKADITIFNLETLKDTATYADPHRYPEGIPYVIVNGVPTIWKGKETGTRNGEIIKR